MTSVGYTDAAPIVETVDQPALAELRSLTANTFAIEYRVAAEPRGAVVQWSAAVGSAQLGGRVETRMSGPPWHEDPRSDPFFMIALTDLVRAARVVVRRATSWGRLYFRGAG